MNRPRKKDRHLPAKMYFRHGRHWYVSGGRWKPLAKDVGQALAEYGRILGESTGRMDALIDRVLDHITPKLKSNTIAQYKIAAKKLKAILAEFAPDQVKGKHVAAIKVHHAKTPNMANRMLSLLRTVFAYALEWQLVETNPCIGIKRHNEAKRTRYVTDEEFTAVREFAPARLAAIMDILFFTGQRIGDVLKIRTADLTDDGIYFEQQKTGARLVVKWTPELRAAIDRAKALGENVRGLTLFHTRGKRVSYFAVRDQFNRATKAAGIEDMTLHDLRAKALTDANRQGKDPQKLGGHSDAKMTARYIRRREIDQVEPPSFGQSNRQAVKKP